MKHFFKKVTEIIWFVQDIENPSKWIFVCSDFGTEQTVFKQSMYTLFGVLKKS